MAPGTRSGKPQAKDIISKAQLVIHLQGDVALLLDPDIVDKRLQKKRGSDRKPGSEDTVLAAA